MNMVAAISCCRLSLLRYAIRADITLVSLMLIHTTLFAAALRHVHVIIIFDADVFTMMPQRAMLYRRVILMPRTRQEKNTLRAVRYFRRHICSRWYITVFRRYRCFLTPFWRFHCIFLPPSFRYAISLYWWALSFLSFYDFDVTWWYFAAWLLIRHTRAICFSRRRYSLMLLDATIRSAAAMMPPLLLRCYRDSASALPPWERSVFFFDDISWYIITTLLLRYWWRYSIVITIFHTPTHMLFSLLSPRPLSPLFTCRCLLFHYAHIPAISIFSHYATGITMSLFSSVIFDIMLLLSRLFLHTPYFHAAYVAMPYWHRFSLYCWRPVIIIDAVMRDIRRQMPAAMLDMLPLISFAIMMPALPVCRRVTKGNSLLSRAILIWKIQRHADILRRYAAATKALHINMPIPGARAKIFIYADGIAFICWLSLLYHYIIWFISYHYALPLRHHSFAILLRRWELFATDVIHYAITDVRIYFFMMLMPWLLCHWYFHTRLRATPFRAMSRHSRRAPLAAFTHTLVRASTGEDTCAILLLQLFSLRYDYSRYWWYADIMLSASAT